MTSADAEPSADVPRGALSGVRRLLDAEGRQQPGPAETYRCRGCGKRSQPDAAYRRAAAARQRQARAMRAGGMGVRAIAAVLEVSPATVSRWTADG